jgi:hypothetical protein
MLGRLESPVAALELASSPPRVLAILDQGDRRRDADVMLTNTYMDFAFIGLSHASALKVIAGCILLRGLTVDLHRNDRANSCATMMYVFV